MSSRYHESYIRRVPIFTLLPSHLFERVAAAFEQVRYSAGDMILVQGTIPTGLYILLQGQAVWVQSAPNGTVNQLGTMLVGQHIHDEALFRDNSVDTASLQAVATCTMLILSRKSMKKLLLNNPELQEIFGVKVAMPPQKAKPAPKQKALRSEAETINVGSFSPFVSNFDTPSGSTVYRKHWLLWILHVAFPMLFCLAALGSIGTVLFGNPAAEIGAYAWAASGLVFFFGTSWFFAADWLWRNDFYLLSDSHIAVVKRPSLLEARQTELIYLRNLQDIGILPPSLWQRIMGYGDLQLSFLDGAKPTYLENVANPFLLQSEIVRRQQASIHRSAQDTERREREALNQYRNAYDELKANPSAPSLAIAPELAPRPSPFGQPRPKTGEIQPEQYLPPNPLMPPQVGMRPPKFPRKREP